MTEFEQAYKDYDDRCKDETMPGAAPGMCLFCQGEHLSRECNEVIFDPWVTLLRDEFHRLDAEKSAESAECAGESVDFRELSLDLLSALLVVEWALNGFCFACDGHHSNGHRYPDSSNPHAPCPVGVPIAKAKALLGESVIPEPTPLTFGAGCASSEKRLP